MVVTNKRKRKDASSRLDVSPEIPKRIKVHAQRKFAQGALCPPIILPIVTPAREETKPQPPQTPIDLIPTRRPNTEDFLTFLCFRGTPILPPRLDFFNNAPGLSSTSATPEESPVSTSQQQSPAQTAFIPFGVRKRALVYPERNTSLRKHKLKEDSRKSNESVKDMKSESADSKTKSNRAKDLRNANQLKMDKTRQHRVTVQALRKKYQEQKMAKLRAVAFSKISDHSVRTRSCSTIHSPKCTPNKPETITKKSSIIPKKQMAKPIPISKTVQAKISLRNQTSALISKKPILPKPKMSLRSANLGMTRNFKPRNFTRQLPVRTRTAVKKVMHNVTAKKLVSDDVGKQKIEKVEPEKRNFKLVKSDKSEEVKPVSKVKDIVNTVNNTQVKDVSSDYSSDDDKPLLKVSEKELLNVKIKPKNKDVPLIKKSEKNQSTSKVNISKKAVLIPKTDKAPNKQNIKKDLNKTSVKSESKEETKKVKIIKSDKIIQKSKSISKDNDSVKSVDIKTVAKIENSNDDSDNMSSKGQKNSRPSRKTKEAATLYMELLGQRLNTSNNADEDDLSIGSYPELPNVRKTEQMEIEMKAQNVKSGSLKNEKSYSDSSTVKPDVKSKIEETGNVTASFKEDLVKINEILTKDYDTSSETPSESDSNLSLYETSKVKIDKNTSRCKLRSDRAIVCDKVDLKMKKKRSVKKKVEKSFSDSDEEPLALKVNIKNKSEIENPKVVESEKITENVSETKECTKLLDLDDFITDKKNAESTPIKSTALTNPVPSLEESQKIFGIAKRINFDSVTNSKTNVKKPDMKVNKINLTDKYKSPTKVEKEIKSLSRGRLLLDNECGDVGTNLPPNEIQNLGLSPKELRNKRRVNMSAEEIEKWLNESCFEPDAIEDDLIISDSDLQKYALENQKEADKKNKFFDKDIKKKSDEKLDSVKIVSSEPSSSKNERKLIFNQRRSITKIPTPVKTSPIKNKQAFSPENETSVYSFNLDDHPTPFSTPFRPNFDAPSGKRKSNETQKKITKANMDKVKKPRKTNNKTETTTKINTEINTVEKSLILTQEHQSKSSIAVQCDFQSESKISLPQTTTADFQGNMEISTQTEDALANEGHLFYIPLQNSKSGENISEQLIQGVAVKLGTEGPDGPNQRVIMRAKLVTKAQISNQLGDSTVSVDEALMKNILGGKICDLKNRRLNNPCVPIGTVQPLARLTKNDEPKSTETTTNTTPTKTQFRSYLKHTMTSETKSDSIPQSPSKTLSNLSKQSTNFSDIMDAPTFYPSEKQFLDPITFIEQITPIAAKYGLCRIVPPNSFKPECKVSDDMRFTAYNQYVNRMMYRFGPSVQEMLAIKKYLATQSITLTHAPWIGGMEIDLPRLYHTVQELGGLKEVIEKKKWHRVAEEMCIPKSAQDRVTKLDDIYCKYLLPYDTLSPAERQKLLTEVKEEWSRKEKLYRQKQQEKYADLDKQGVGDKNSDKDRETDSDSEVDSESDRDLRECTLKGRNMALSQFFRIARNTMAVWFKSGSAEPDEVESQYWEHVSRRDRHVCVHVGSIDSSGCGYGFPAKNSPFAKHPWNLKVLTNNSGSVLRSLGPVMGVTVPTLHVGMLFSACCWYRDPHGLPWIEYLHTGANKIWYGIPDRASSVFREALSVLAPQSVLPQTIWLPSDSAMVPPGELLSRQVPLSRTVQKPGEFILVCPKAYTSSLCTGYTVSESVYYATKDWLDSAHNDFKDIQESREPTMFSLEQLLISIASDPRAQDSALRSIIDPLQAIVEREKTERSKLSELGVQQKFDRSDKSASSTSHGVHSSQKQQTKVKGLTGDHECDVCRTNLFVSMVTHKEEDTTLCPRHAITHLSSDKNSSKNNSNNQWQLIYSYSVDELESLFEKVNES